MDQETLNLGKLHLLSRVLVMAPIRNPWWFWALLPERLLGVARVPIASEGHAVFLA